MARRAIPVTINGPEGKPIAGATVTIRYVANDTLATIYSGLTGGGTLVNPQISDRYGRLLGYLESGEYRAFVRHGRYKDFNFDFPVVADPYEGPPGPAGVDGALSRVQNEAVDVPQRGKLNFTGDGVFLTDDTINDRTNVVISGGAGGGGSDATYVHNQITPSNSWMVTHNLNKFPSVTVVDSAGSEIRGGLRFLDPNNVEITFGAAFGGKAYFN